MGLFRKSSNASQRSGGSGGKVNITKDDMKNYKMRSGVVHDPILSAVNEQQPFENAAVDQQDGMNRNSYQGGAALNDVFGKPIHRPDISNPTRARDERPLDTIRSFEYAITGDNSYKDRLESDALGFRVRQDFPRFPIGGVNPYDNSNGGHGQGPQQPVHSFSGGNDEMFEQGVYQAPAQSSTEKKKKKRGLFGKKK